MPPKPSALMQYLQQRAEIGHNRHCTSARDSSVGGNMSGTMMVIAS